MAEEAAWFSFQSSIYNRRGKRTMKFELLLVWPWRAVVVLHEDSSVAVGIVHDRLHRAMSVSFSSQYTRILNRNSYINFIMQGSLTHFNVIPNPEPVSNSDKIPKFLVSRSFDQSTIIAIIVVID
ncbi:hypothetical protein Nepgr_004771 [Nepenthes gracilis]|uniref:Uncharacterized protein n=1 Tax=Nepenthes gracilis TaxID=150966 RepID=A0AAD3S244_NEPGR|nr:hypothetical protein Nepgr_004771 [Nepenthes gracilis]